MLANSAGIATRSPASVQASAEATPGAMAVRFASPAYARLAKVFITPHTVPNKPRKGPPATLILMINMPAENFLLSYMDSFSSAALKPLIILSDNPFSSWSEDPFLSSRSFNSSHPAA
jgi:hypothetical protein